MKQKPDSPLDQATILILDAPPTDRWIEREILKGTGIEAHWIDAHDTGGTPTAEQLGQADAILTFRRAVDANMIEQAGRCLLIGHYGPGAGPDAAQVDLEAARRAGIYVTSVPDFAPDDWADETFHLLLRLVRGALDGPPRTLSSLKLGIVGLGQVGRRVAHRAREFGMDILACDPFIDRRHFESSGARRTDLNELAGMADVMTLHLPLVEATRSLIGAETLRLVKPGACLINVSAPDLVDASALAESMARRRPAAAAFDEDLALRLPADHPLLAQQGLIHGPRRAGTSLQAMEGRRREMGRLLANVLCGGRPPHLLIDPPCPRQIMRMAGEE